ncbi:MAG TPA: hypothetical protein VGI84_09580 [Pseudonocardiaceae bacterium]
MTRTDPVNDAVCQAFAAGTRIDLHRAEVPAALFVELLTSVPPPSGGAIPALRLAGAVVRGPLELPGARVAALTEFTDCTFDDPLDLYAAELAGWRFEHCTLPGVRAANLRVHSEFAVVHCTVRGSVVVSDARVEGPLRLIGTRLGDGGEALVGVRLQASGVLDARGMRADGQVRLSGASVDGNIDLRGAHLFRPGGDALDAAGVRVGGNLRCDREFRAQGRVVLSGATVTGNAVFSGATLQGSTDPDDRAVLVLPRGHADPTASLVADRIAVNGNLELDAGFSAGCCVRLTSATIGGYLRLSGATLGSPLERGRQEDGPEDDGPDYEERSGPVPVALAADGIEVRGDVEARGARPDGTGAAGALQAHGQVRLVGAWVHGSASLSGAHLHGPGLDVLFADRLRVGGTLFLRGMVASGSIRLHHATIGSTLDCTAARLDAPRRRWDGTLKPSLDARAATIGKDLYASRGFTATGGVRLSLAEVSKTASFEDAVLGSRGAGVGALRVRGLKCQELILRFAAPPQGEIQLAGVSAGAVLDSAHLWAAEGAVDVEDFRYESLTAAPDVDVHTRLHWLRRALVCYDPDPYDQLALSYRDGGHDDRADIVLLVKQRHRHAVHGPAGRIWGLLQEWTVGYGYRPWRATAWLAAAWFLGSLWFVNHRLQRLDSGQNPSWQPVLYAADLLVPVVNLGQDGLWRTSGLSAWVAGVLTAVGWLLLSTAAAGVTRILTRR